MDYREKAYEYAKAQGWTSQQVLDATRVQVAVACGINDLEAAKSDPGWQPAKFLAWHIKDQVARRLDADELEADKEAIKAQVKLFADSNGLLITRWREGDPTDGLLLHVRRAE